MNMIDTSAAQYGELFDALLRHSREAWEDRSAVLAHVGERMRPEVVARALDMGAGSGDGAAWLLERMSPATVIAVEPDPLCLERLTRRLQGADRATIVEATVDQWLRTSSDTGFDMILLLSVLYHVPRDAWADVIAGLTHRLSPSGVAIVSMKDPASGCNRMIRHFGGEPLDIVSFFEAYRPAGWHVVHMVAPTSIRTQSLDELEKILRFMLADVALERSIGGEALRAYAREHFDRGDGGWELPVPEQMYAVTRDEATARRIAEGSRSAARHIWAG